MRIRYFRIGRLVACIPLATAVLIGVPLATAQSTPDLLPPTQKSSAAAPGTIYSLEQLIQLALESNPRVLQHAIKQQPLAGNYVLPKQYQTPNLNTTQDSSAPLPDH